MAEFASNSLNNLNPKRRMTAMEIKKQQKQRKSLGFSLITNTNILSSQQINKEDEQDELIKEKTIFNESSGKTVKEILGKGENSSIDMIRQSGGQISGENSNSMKMFNSQFNNFYQEFYQNNTTIYELQKKQSSQQTQKKDQKQQIIDEKGNYQLINEVSLISAVNFDWFKDLFSSTQQLSGYDTSNISKEGLQLIKQQIKNQLSTYKYEKSQSVLSGFNSQFNKEKSIMKNQEIYLTMRNCYQNFLQNRQHFYYYVNAQFIVLFIHVQNDDARVNQKVDKDRIVAVVWAKTLKSFDKFLENSGIEFTDISELQRKQKEAYLLQEKKKRLQQENLQYFQDDFAEDQKLSQDLRITEMEENYNQAILKTKNQKQNKLMQDENNEDTQSNLPFSTLIDNQSTVLLIKKKYVQSLQNCLINQNLEKDQDSHSSFQKMEIISNFAFEHSQKCNLKEYFNGQIISSDVQQYSYLLDEMEENQFVLKSQCNNLEQIFQIDNSNKLYNLKLKGEIPFTQIKEIVGLLNKLNINFAIFYQENPQTKYFKGDIIKFDN
ncbi:hypothetical protein ABPG72_011643 [Tetrahymena utriculariae]